MTRWPDREMSINKWETFIKIDENGQAGKRYLIALTCESWVELSELFLRYGIKMDRCGRDILTSF